MAGITMSQQWHYSQDGAQYGPVDEVEIYPRKRTSTKAAASGETSQPTTQTGEPPIIASALNESGFTNRAGNLWRMANVRKIGMANGLN